MMTTEFPAARASAAYPIGAASGEERMAMIAQTPFGLPVTVLASAAAFLRTSTVLSASAMASSRHMPDATSTMAPARYLLDSRSSAALSRTCALSSPVLDAHSEAFCAADSAALSAVPGSGSWRSPKMIVSSIGLIIGSVVPEAIAFPLM